MTVRSTSNRLLIGHQKTLESESWILKWLKALSLIYLVTPSNSILNLYSDFEVNGEPLIEVFHQTEWRFCQYPHLIAIFRPSDIRKVNIKIKWSSDYSNMQSSDKVCRLRTNPRIFDLSNNDELVRWVTTGV